MKGGGKNSCSIDWMQPTIEQKELRRELERLSHIVVEVGYWAQDDSKLALIAGVQNWGAAIKVTPKMRGWLGAHGLHLKHTTEVIVIPATAFMSRGMTAYARDTFPLQLAKELDAMVMERRKAVTVGNRIGLALVSAIQESIDKTEGPPLHPFTLSRRRQGKGGGRARRLRDSGRLRSGVTHRVVIE